ncbi:uncharacterized protein LOC121424538 [Lytechinus variegatus]|uniref:uncharacterized protein LOC121424238 n=1 Tax=Lytechinus variegatus TaxID=7654 RepID=UPI001BB0EA6A|nr:uncharacterized protein LOC121424238 [Lytechinus variegatus]XP_041476190.1 uncharacterized protein LOC121424538 [Lytechinus variegatus]
MATLSKSVLLYLAVILIVAALVSDVECSRNSRPYHRPRGSSRRLGIGRGRSQDSLQREPSYHHDPAPEVPSATQVRNAGRWFQNFIASKDPSNNPPNPSPERSSDLPEHREKVIVRPPIIRKGSIVTSPKITMIYLETVHAMKRNTSRDHQPSRPGAPEEADEEVVTNEATTHPSSSRPSRTPITADEVRIQCGGPNEAGKPDECYRFELPAELNNNAIVIRGAIVLLPAGNRSPTSRNHDNTSPRTVHHNVTIVAKFPTSGEGAYRESISVQNISYDAPWTWKSASLPQGSSLVSRALQEDNTLLLKLSVISNDNGNPTISNFIPMESNKLPVLVVDVEFNGTNPSTASSSTTTTATLRTTQLNVVERQIRERRAVAWRGTEDFMPNNTLTCSGFPGCCRRTLDISFSDLGWHWIISPRRLTTSVCFGSCLTPTSSMTFESFMVNLMQVDGPSPQHDRKCRPSRSEDFDALVFAETGDIQIMRVPNLIVHECSCSKKRVPKIKTPPEEATTNKTSS